MEIVSARLIPIIHTHLELVIENDNYFFSRVQKSVDYFVERLVSCSTEVNPIPPDEFDKLTSGPRGPVMNEK
jgi:hypothetical protein